MLQRLGPKLTYSNIVSTLCLFLLLGGGAYAASTLAKNSVGSKQIAANAVTRSKIAHNAVTSSKVANGSLLRSDFASGQLPAGTPGAQGPRGTTGADGPPGPTASGAASSNPEPDSAIDPFAFSDLTGMNTTVTTTTPSRLIGSASIQVELAMGTPSVACQIKIDGAFVGEFEQVKLPPSGPVVISLSQGAVVAAGPHTVSIACQVTGASSLALFDQGNITAIATAV